MIMKRNSNFFDVYIIKLLKNISENAEICRDTRNQINIIIQIFCQKIVDIVYLLLKNTKKKTITLNTVSHGIEIFLLGVPSIYRRLFGLAPVNPIFAALLSPGPFT